MKISQKISLAFLLTAIALSLISVLIVYFFVERSLAVHLSSSHDEVECVVLNVLRMVLLGIVIIVPIAAFTVGSLAGKLITRPLYELLKGMRLVAQGDFDQGIQIETKDEIAELLKEYQKMLDSLKYNMSSREELIKEIAGKERAQKELILSQENLSSITENVPDIIMRLDPQGKILFLNRSAYGIAVDQVVGKSIYDFIVPEFHQQMKDSMRSVFEERRVVSYENSVRIPGVGIRLFDNRLAPIISEQDVVAAALIASDITETMRRDKRIRFLSSVVEQSSEGMAIADLHGKILFANFAWAKMHGYATPEELAGKDLKIFHTAEQLKDEVEPFNDEVRDKGSKTGEIGHVRKDGTVFQTMMTSTLIKDSEGKTFAISGMAEDITDIKKNELLIKEQAETLQKTNRFLESNESALKKMLQDMEHVNQELKAAQEQLIQSEKMATVGQLSAGVAHEIKNPLAIILLSIETLERKITNIDEKGRNKIQMIKDAANRANKVVIELLNFSRQNTTTLTPLEINRVLESSISLIHNKLKLTRIKILSQIEKTEGTIVEGDDVLLGQVFFNLLSNAIDSISGEGTITITTCVVKQDDGSQERVKIELADTGCGMSEEVQAKMFDPFFTSKEQGKGTGLGLSTVYMILERHKGEISVESKDGVGTKFKVSLPVSSVEKQEEHRNG